MNTKKLIEGAVIKHFMTKDERLLRKSLVNLLVKNNHVKYAKRLSKFDVNIVPLKVDSDFTAAISFDEGVIFISEGFLNDKSVFFQLDVILRHELAHNLLMHQIRMLKKVGPKLAPYFKASATLHDLLNIIEDFEISNTRYTAKDKDTMRHLWLNGRLIACLVTEDIRKNWETLSVEQMYDQLTEELKKIHALILEARQDPFGSAMYELSKKLDNDPNNSKKDYIAQEVLTKYSSYSSPELLKAPSRVSGSISNFNTGKAYLFLGIDPKTNKPVKLYYKDIHPLFQKTLTNLEVIFEASDSIFKKNPTQNEIDRINIMIKEISETSLIQSYIIDFVKDDGSVDPNRSIEILAPEEKFIVIEFLKKIKSLLNKSLKLKTTFSIKKISHSDEYIAAYNSTIEILDNNNYSDEDLTDILNAINATVNNLGD